jgi:DUF971 family protein
MTAIATVASTAITSDVSADLSALSIEAGDGRGLTLSAEALRAACKCAHCTRARFDERFPPGFPGIAITGVNDLGYGLNISFSDGHNRGIYPKTYLFELARR